MAGTVSRRSFVQLLGAASVFAGASVHAETASVTPKSTKAKAPAKGSTPKDASSKGTSKSQAKNRASKTDTISRLIAESRAETLSISQRIDFISRGLMGVRYVANTLIGGPDQPEQFVVRDDALDCVTFCETVLAGALARDLREFEGVLRRIRYVRGDVRWDARNHYFSEWCRANVENKTCQWVDIPDAVITKTVNSGNLGERPISFRGIPRRALLSKGAPVVDGDIAGFASRLPNLDFFHTGLVMVGEDGGLILRHASLRRRRVIQEPLAGFLTTNNVDHVALLRAVEQPSGAARG